MAQTYSYTQCRILANDEFILANSAKLTNNNNLEASYRLGENTAIETAAKDEIQTNLSLIYYPVFNDIFHYSITNDSPINVKLASLNLTSGYVNAYTIQARPNDFIQCQSDMIFFNQISDKFANRSISHARVHINQNLEDGDIDFAHSSAINLTQNLMNVPISFTYKYESDIIPCIKIGDYYSSDHRFSTKKITFNIEGERLDKFVQLEGEDAIVSFQLKNMCNENLQRKEYEITTNYIHNAPVQTYTCSGKITSMNIDATSNNFLHGNISIVQYL